MSLRDNLPRCFKSILRVVWSPTLAREKEKYSGILYENSFSNLQRLPDISTDTFQLTSHSVPFYRPPSTKKEEGSGSGSLVCVAQPLPLHELVRVTNYQGYFILGYPEPLWEAMGMMEALSNAPKVDFLSLQKLPIAVRDLEELPADLMTRGGAGAEYQALSYRPTPMKLKTTTTRKGVNGVEEKVEEEEEVAAIKYYIAVARKLRN
eukprot:scaffold3709_cov193-Ochromonas_danica.AAC.2